MKFIYLLSFALVVSTCSNPSTKNSDLSTTDDVKADKTTEDSTAQYETISAFQDTIDSAKMSGAVLIYDLTKDHYYSNDFERAEQGFLPASTFKIPNSIIALETGIIRDPDTLLKWNGEKRKMKFWETDMTFHEAYHKSCLPCYQEMARKVGFERMQEMTQKLAYGNMKFNEKSHDVFWVEGESRISAMQQIDFLVRLYKEQLPISDRTYLILRDLMILEKNDEYILRGKTGWSIRDGFNIGWFVGYLESNGQVYFFATNVDPQVDFDMNQFPIIRSQITMAAFKSLQIIN